MSNVFIPRAIAATNIDASNRSFVSTVEMEQGMVLVSGARSTTPGEAEVFVADTPATGSLMRLWMAFEAEVVLTEAGRGTGKFYKGLDPDARNFFIPAGLVFSGFLPEVGDIIEMTGGATFPTNPNPTTNIYLVAQNGSNSLAWATAPSTTALTLKVIEPSYISIADGSTLGALQRDNSYIFEVINN